MTKATSGALIYSSSRVGAVSRVCPSGLQTNSGVQIGGFVAPLGQGGNRVQVGGFVAPLVHWSGT